MDQYLSVIKYLYRKAGFENTDESINSFFDNGCSFPQLISLIFNIEKIPETKEKPYSNYFKQLNNLMALQYLFGQNKSIETINPKIETESDKINVLKLLFTKQCFPMTPRDIISTSNMILNTHYRHCSEIRNIKFLLSLLSILTGNEIYIKKESNENNFDIIIHSFQKELIPLILDKNSFNSDDNIFFLIQVQIVLTIFTEKIKDIKNKIEVTKKKLNKDSIVTSINPTITIDDDSIDKNDKKSGMTYKKEEYMEEHNEHEKLLTDQDTETKIWYPQEKQEDLAMLKTINLIAQDLQICEMNECDSFEFTLFNNFIPLFVMRYRNIELIPNVKKIERSKEDPLTYQEIKNIKIVIDYLKKEEKSFQLLLFDFDSPFLFVNSAKLFFKVFLNTYFVKKTRIEMMERCNELIGDLKWYSKEKIFTKRRYDTFTGLLSFITLIQDKETNSDENTSYDYFIDLSDLFEKADVPRIITIDILDDFYHDSDSPDSLYYQQPDKELPDSIIYQLQFIFNKIDSLQSLRLVETLRIANHKIKNMKCPKFDTIKLTVKSKIQALKIKNNINKTNILKEEKEAEKELNSREENKPISFLKRKNISNIDDYYNKKFKKDAKIILAKEKIMNNSDSIRFWNPYDKKYKVEDGILSNNNEINQSTNDFISLISQKEKKIAKIMNFKSEKSYKTSTSNPIDLKSSSDILLMARSSRFSFDTTLYKLFYFDEINFKWIFDSEVFNNFAIDKKINIEEAKTPLIFYFNSNKKDLETINLNFIMAKYPILDDNQIFIYPLCERELSKLNTRNDFNPDKISKKPIFLLLHIPKEKENLPFVSIAIQQIYSFLSFVCDLSIIIYNDKFISSQIEICKNILKIAKSSFPSIENKHEKLELILLKNKINADYKYCYDLDLLRQNSVLELQSNDTVIPVNFYLANFEDFNTYKPFIDYVSEICLKSNKNFSIIKNIFYNFDCSHISGLYIQIYTQNSWKEELKRIIKDRFLMLKSNDPNFDKNPEIILSKLYDEFSSFAPLNNIEFQNECNLCYNSMRKTFTKQNNKEIIEELKKSSDENIKYLKNLLFKNDVFWTKNQIDNMTVNHIRFLKNEYLNIIKSVSDIKLIHLIYLDNLEILNSQIEVDKKTIEEIKKPILEKIKEKNNAKNVDALEKSKKGTNYTLKEKENIREIEVSVISADKLETEIPQDF